MNLNSATKLIEFISMYTKRSHYVWGEGPYQDLDYMNEGKITLANDLLNFIKFLETEEAYEKTKTGNRKEI